MDRLHNAGVLMRMIMSVALALMLIMFICVQIVHMSRTVLILLVIGCKLKLALMVRSANQAVALPVALAAQEKLVERPMDAERHAMALALAQMNVHGIIHFQIILVARQTVQERLAEAMVAVGFVVMASVVPHQVMCAIMEIAAHPIAQEQHARIMVVEEAAEYPAPNLTKHATLLLIIVIY